MNALGYYTQDKKCFEYTEDEDNLLTDYKYLEYNSIIEKLENRSTFFFGEIIE